MLSHLEDEESIEQITQTKPLENDQAIEAIIQALSRIFEHRPKNEKEAIKPLTIMQTLFNENNLIIDVIMEKLTVHMVMYIRDYYEDKVGDFPKNFLDKFTSNT